MDSHHAAQDHTPEDDHAEGTASDAAHADAPAAAGKCRLPERPGEWIDRGRPLRFKFEGREYTGFAGDTITSALCAHGQRVLGRSFKYHRARGVYSLANHDVNCLVEDAQRTNIRADVTPLWDGADLKVVNTFGGLVGDWGRWLDWFSPFLPVGFYYKAFHRPRGLFPFWERRMRAMAGLGSVDQKRSHRPSPKDYDFCDVVVIGAGPAGIAAARAAAEQGCDVLLVDENPRPGGSLAYQYHGQHAERELAASLLHDLGQVQGLRVRTSTVVAGCYADFWLALVDDKRLTKLRARTIVVATGCHELPAVFGNNDLPGVMLASAAQRLIHGYSVRPCDRAIVLGANAEAYGVALDLANAGVQVRALVDLRPQGQPGDATRKLAELGIPIHRGHAVQRAIPSAGKMGIQGATVCALDAQGQPQAGKSFSIEADGIAISVGWASADSLIHQAGGRTSWSEEQSQYLPSLLPRGMFVAGRANGVFPLPDQIADGRRAGLASACFLGRSAGPAPTHGPRGAESHNHPYPVFVDAKAKCFVDLDEDVHYKDIVNAAQEGFDQVELLKRYSTFGMGPSQGKIANVNAVRILSRVKGQPVGATGTPTSRPFVHPVPLGVLAGRSFHPHRRTPLHARHDAAGAEWMPAGEWMRPACYRRDGVSRDEVIQEEVRAVRTRAGLIDVGTLGKLEVNGPDAAEFLERIYTGRFAKMKVGTTRYGLMCDESGVVIDDGVVARLAEDRFYVTTTTTGSAGVYREMQRWALIWGSRVVLANVTGSMAAINLAGPRSRSILAAISDLDTSEKSFPYLALRESRILQAECRVLRTGFVGEVAYEIHLPACLAARVWDALIEAGRGSQIRPFGVEAQRVLRLEKGHVIVSQDTDGLTTPDEAGIGGAVKRDKKFFVGQRSLEIMAKRSIARHLVGFTLAPEFHGERPKECNLVIDRGTITGRVTSISTSPTLSRVIGLAYVGPTQTTPGTTFQIRRDKGDLVEATVVPLPFYDPDNQRQQLA